MTYLTVIALLWGVIATERAFYWNGEYKYKECDCRRG